MLTSLNSPNMNHPSSSLLIDIHDTWPMRWLEKSSNSTAPYQNGDDYFYYSTEATIITCTAGALSTLSSLLIVLIILRSKETSFSSYHRVMLFMSISDIIASAPITLATLPIPSDTLYPFSTLTLGNKNTCSAQAFTIVFGQVCAVLSNVILNLYYLFKIRYNKSDDFIRKKLEPIGFTLAVAIGLLVVFTALAYDMLNPVPDWPLCYTGSAYPWNCLGNDEVECIAGNISLTEYTVFISLFFGLMGFVFITVLISLILVVLSVFKTKKALNKIQTDKASDGLDETMEIEQTGIGNTHSVLKVALMYIGAFILTYGWAVLSVAIGSFNQLGAIRYFLDRAKLLFNPAQGFFNLLIFLYNKIHILRESRNGTLSFRQAFRIVIVNPSEVPDFLIPSLDIIDKDIAMREKERKEQKEMMDKRNDSFEDDMVLDRFALSSVSTPSGFSKSIGIESLSTTSEPTKQETLKRISNIFSKEASATMDVDQFHRGVSNPENMLSVGTPDSVLGTSSRNGEDLSYLSTSFNGTASEGVVSSSASTVKR